MINSAKEFVELREKNDPRATYEKAARGVWLEVIHDFPDYKAWVAHNKTVPVTILRILARDADAQIRFWVAMKRKCPHDVFKRLAFDEDESVRVRIAWNAKTPPDILEMLQKDCCRKTLAKK